MRTTILLLTSITAVVACSATPSLPGGTDQAGRASHQQWDPEGNCLMWVYDIDGHWHFTSSDPGDPSFTLDYVDEGGYGHYWGIQLDSILTGYLPGYQYLIDSVFKDGKWEPLYIPMDSIPVYIPYNTPVEGPVLDCYED